jgi:Holliday junction DNA helicase RuvB
MIAEILATLGIIPLTKTTDEVSKPAVFETKPVKFSFRPKTLDEYIGQEKAKDNVRLNLQKIMEIKPVHFLINGTKGHGKTTLANIIGNSLGFKIYYYIGGAFNFETLKDFLYKNEESPLPNILFVDEIHNLPKDVGEFLYPILEDFILPTNNAPLRPFIFIGATTEKSTLLKKFAPLVDRCGCQIQLEHYNADETKTILKQYNAQTYKAEVSEEIYDLLSNNVRFTPRIAISMFDDYMVCKNIDRVLKSRRIIKNGLTDIDIKLLRHMAEIKKPVGEETLAILAQMDRTDYKMLVEPYLCQQEYMSRTNRGRVITNKGIELLNSL